MALRILQPGIQPVGQFDLMDSYASTIMGGEIGTVWRGPRSNTSSEVAAFDARQSMDNTSDQRRLMVAPYLGQNGLRPLWLLDDGSSGYGILFGQIVGSVLGRTNSNLGPQTNSGSGKVTVWNKPGTYGVTLDAVDTDATLGLVPTNTSLFPGDPIFPMSNGKLTPTPSRAPGGAVGADVVARFLEFRLTSNTLVTTPRSLVDASSYAFDHIVMEYGVEG